MRLKNIAYTFPSVHSSVSRSTRSLLALRHHFLFSGEVILASQDDLLVYVVEDGIQIPGELSNTGQMDGSLHDFRTTKRGQLHLLETS